MEYKNQLQNQSWPITISTFLILIAGVVTLYSTGLGTDGSRDLTNQISFIVIGLVFYFGLMFFNYTYLKFLPVQILTVVGAYLPLVLVLFFGVTRNNATRWFDLGFGTLQPSEFSKIFLTVIFAFILTQFSKYPEWVRGIIAVASSIAMAALIFIQPNLSTALIVIAMGLFMFLAFSKEQFYWFLSFISLGIHLAIFSGIAYLNLSNTFMVKVGPVTIDFILLAGFLCAQFLLAVFFKKLRIFLAIALGGALLLAGSSALLWNVVLKDYQKERIMSYINPEDADAGQKFQGEQAKVAIGSGLFDGKGFGQGTQSNLNFLPEQHTDFIFASYAEEFGFRGSVVLVGLYIFLVLSILWVALHTKDMFGFVICIGIATMFLLESFINIGVNVGIMPSTGVALPLMSLGGSSMWAKLIALGLVQSVAIFSRDEGRGLSFKL